MDREIPAHQPPATAVPLARHRVRTAVVGSIAAGSLVATGALVAATVGGTTATTTSPGGYASTGCRAASTAGSRNPRYASE